MRRFGLLIAVLLILLPLISCSKSDQVGADLTGDKFNAEIQALVEDGDIIQLCRKYIKDASDIDVKRQAQSTYIDIDPEGALAYSRELLDENSDSPIFTYLYGRAVQTPAEQIETARKVIELDPGWPYGYRLLTATYSSELFRGDETDEQHIALKAMLADDSDLIQKMMAFKDDDPDLSEDMKGYLPDIHKFVIDYLIFNKNYAQASDYMGLDNEAPYDWVEKMDIARVYIGLKKYNEARKEIADAVTERFANDLTAEEIEEYIDHYTLALFGGMKAYDEAIRYIESQKGYKKDPDKLYNLACLNALKEDMGKAFYSLTRAVEQGYDLYEQAESDSDLDILRDDNRWQAIIEKMKVNWDKGAPERKKEVLGNKFSEIAPLFSLPGIDGDSINLADLKGKVVILDFWATWCGPCRMAMPELDKFVDNLHSEDIAVFSVNVWENNRKGAQTFMEQNQYDMTLIYGSRELTDAYKVSGIPTIVVIDKEGNLRYKQIGYSQGLTEKLTWWTDDLL